MQRLPLKMNSLDDSPTIDKLYAIALDQDHSYKSEPQMAFSLLSSVTEILQSSGISDTAALKLAISFIHFDSAHNLGPVPRLHAVTTVFQPHTTMGIVHLLRNAIEIEVDNIDVEDDTGVTSAESAILRCADVVLPWLWRASHHGIQSDFAQSVVVSHGRPRLNVDIIMVTISLPPYS